MPRRSGDPAAGPDMNTRQLQTLMRCVECGTTQVGLRDATLVCADCGHQWRMVDGIYDLRPRSPLPLPAMYLDRHYLTWQQRLAAAQDYFYGSGGVVRWVQNAGHRVVNRWSDWPKDAVILDLGCGDGAHRPFLESTENVIGLDIDQASLRKLRDRHPDFFVVRGDAGRLPFADGTIDVVLSLYNLEHVLYMDWVLEEVRRVLKPNGRFMVSVPAEGGWAWRLGRALTSLRAFSDDDFDYARSNAIDHCNCVWQIERTLRRHFKVERCSRFPFALPSYHLNLIVTWCAKKHDQPEPARRVG